MTIEEINALNLGWRERITIKAWLPPETDEYHKVTFVTVSQPDKRMKRYVLSYFPYKSGDMRFVDIAQIDSINRGWEN